MAVSCAICQLVAAVLLLACLLHPAAVAARPAIGANISSGNQRFAITGRSRAANADQQPRIIRSAAARRHGHSSRRQLAASITAAADAPVILASSSTRRTLSGHPATAPDTEIGA